MQSYRSFIFSSWQIWNFKIYSHFIALKWFLIKFKLKISSKFIISKKIISVILFILLLGIHKALIVGYALGAAAAATHVHLFSTLN